MLISVGYSETGRELTFDANTYPILYRQSSRMEVLQVGACTNDYKRELYVDYDTVSAKDIIKSIGRIKENEENRPQEG